MFVRREGASGEKGLTRTNKNSVDKLLKRIAGLFWLLFSLGRATGIQEYGNTPLPLSLVNSLCYLPFTSSLLAIPLSLQHEIALKTMSEFFITWIVKMKHCFKLINNQVLSFQGGIPLFFDIISGIIIISS